MRRRRQPARLCAAGLCAGCKAQEKRRDTLMRRRQRQPTAGHEIEGFGHARNFDDNRAQRRAGERIAGRAQGTHGIGRAKYHEARRIDPQFEKAAGGQFTEFQRGIILADPDQGPALPDPGSQRRRQPRSGPFGAGVRGEHLMQDAGKEPAVQTGIGAPVAKRDAGGFTFGSV